MEWRALSNPEENGGFCLSPMIEQVHQKVPALEGEVPLEEGDFKSNYIIRCIKIQRQEDLERPVNEQAGIGGEIVLTIMALTEENEFVMQTTTPYTFPDYLIQLEQMLDKSRV